MSEILVIGHRNPDTDSICSAIGYAEFKRYVNRKKVETIAFNRGRLHSRSKNGMPIPIA